MRVFAGLHSYRVIAENRYGTSSSPPRAFAADSPPTAEQIRQGLGLDVLGNDAVAAAERITLQAAEGVAFRSVLESVGKFASKASIVGFLVGFGLSAEPTSCEARLVYTEAKPSFAPTANVLGLVSRAQIGLNRPLFTEINAARTALNQAKQDILGLQFSNDCSGAKKVALATINRLYLVLTAASTHLDALSAKAAQEKKQQQQKKVVCREAIKALTGYNNTFEKVNHRPLDRKTKEKLDAKRAKGTITSKDLPGGLKFPGGPLQGKSLNEIRKLCK